MAITNKYNLPQTLVDAATYNTHPVAGDISVTQLIDAPQVRMLKKQVKGQLDEDITERVWALFGTAVHNILERANIKDFQQRAFLTVIAALREYADTCVDPGDKDKLEKVATFLFKLLPIMFPELEKRYLFETTVRVEVNGMTVYGTFDLYDKLEKRLKDYKVCSVWNYVYPEARKKWYAQINTYSYMVETDLGLPVLGADIVAIFRDWSGIKVGITKDYPERQIMEINIPIYDMSIRQQYIAKRVELHRQAELGNVPECTGAERWAKADEWAIKTPKNKKAMRKFDDEVAAIKFKAENQHLHPNIFIELRPGSSRRCDEYCPVREICPQRKRMVTIKSDNDNE